MTTETRHSNTEHKLRCALSAVAKVEAQGCQVLGVDVCGYTDRAPRVQVMDPGGRLDHIGRHGVHHTPAERRHTERYVLLDGAYVFWLIEKAAA